MNIQARLGTAVGVCIAWFGFVGPGIVDRIHASNLEGPKPFSIQNIRDQMAEDGDTGDTGDTLGQLEIQEALPKLAALELAEEERVMAMYGLLSRELNEQAGQLVGALPPLEYAVDPRFFEPIAPSIVRRSLEIYGYAVSPLPLSTRMMRPEGMDRQDVLMRILSAVHHRLLSPEQAAMVLQGSIELLELQTQRMAIEAELRQFIHEDSTD